MVMTEEVPVAGGEDVSRNEPESPTLAEICEACTELAVQIAAHFEKLGKR